MAEIMFGSRAEFRKWLTENAFSDEGVWLVFNKRTTSDCIKPNEALEEALCFGWIDGQMKSLDESSYIKYFKQRRKGSNWSEKNKRIAELLETNGLMTDFGRAKIEEAKKNGSWDLSGTKPMLTDEQMSEFEDMVEPFEIAYANFQKMTPSVRKAYASSYFFGAKTDAGKAKRFNTIIERLNLNLNPMESMKKKA
ncbi:MAG: YdeI/OmpD-associated family protein [Clostridiales bacterium]|jgi:uncharacterized protein YdeI (YjbR/CyaY-like superfamily)|nr:YdeI/OmpD-associated family protein [Clostridiales bacterium]